MPKKTGSKAAIQCAVAIRIKDFFNIFPEEFLEPFLTDFPLVDFF